MKRTAVYDPGDGLPPWRLNVGLVLVNQAGLIFSGKRSDQPGVGDGWQLPQGGIDEGETSEQAARRELAEEVGARVRADIIGTHPQTLTYAYKDFAEAEGAFNGKYRGQMQHWFYMKMRSPDTDIDISCSHDGEPPEFSAFAWRTPEEILRDIVAAKKPVYVAVLDYLARDIGPSFEGYQCTTGVLKT